MACVLCGIALAESLSGALRIKATQALQALAHGIDAQTHQCFEIVRLGGDESDCRAGFRMQGHRAYSVSCVLLPLRPTHSSRVISQISSANLPLT